MIAEINGVRVEGTPQEIVEFQRLSREQSNVKPFWEMLGYGSIDEFVDAECGPNDFFGVSVIEKLIPLQKLGNMYGYYE